MSELDSDAAGTMIDDGIMVIPTITTHESFQRLEERLSDRGGVIGVSGLWGSSAPLAFAALLASTSRLGLYLTPHLEEADHAREYLETFTGGKVALFPAWETLPGEGAGSGEIHHERLQLCAQMQASRPELILSPFNSTTRSP